MRSGYDTHEFSHNRFLAGVLLFLCITSGINAPRSEVKLWCYKFTLTTSIYLMEIKHLEDHNCAVLHVSKWQNNKSIKLWLKYLRGDYSLIIFWQYKCVNCTRQMLDQNRPVWPQCYVGYGIHKTDTPVLKSLARIRNWLTAKSGADTHEDLRLIRARIVHMHTSGRISV